MPGRATSRPRRDGVDEFFRQEIATYRRALDTLHYERKLNDDRARGEKMLLDLFKKPNPECEALMKRAHKLEDDGHLEEAAALYARILSCPDQVDNHELRSYLAGLIARLNRRQANAKARARQAEVAEAAEADQQRLRLQGPGGGGGGGGGGRQRPRTAGPAFPAAKGPEPGVPRANKPVGPKMPMNPEAYRAELAAQAMAARRQKEEARKQAELLDMKQVAVAAAMDALAQHAQHVVGGNDRIARRNDRDVERRDREDDRIRRHYLEWEQLRAAKEAAAGSPLGGEGEYDRRRREQVQAAHAHRALARNATEGPQDPRALYHEAHGHDPWVREQDLAAAAAAAPAADSLAVAVGATAGGGAYRDQYYYYPGAGADAPSLRQRPASANAVVVARERQRQREAEREREIDREMERRDRAANNAANLGRHILSGHPRAAAGGGGGGFGVGGVAGAVGAQPPGSPWQAWQPPPSIAPLLEGVRAGGGGGGGGAGAGGGGRGQSPRKAGGDRPGGGAAKDIKAPFGRPGVDRPAVPIDPQAVRARQQAYIASRHKPDPPPGPHQVPLRVRRAAERRPSPPRVAPGAVAAGWPLPPGAQR